MGGTTLYGISFLLSLQVMFNILWCVGPIPWPAFGVTLNSPLGTIQFLGYVRQPDPAQPHNDLLLVCSDPEARPMVYLGKQDHPLRPLPGRLVNGAFESCMGRLEISNDPTPLCRWTPADCPQPLPPLRALNPNHFIIKSYPDGVRIFSRPRMTVLTGEMPNKRVVIMSMVKNALDSVEVFMGSASQPYCGIRRYVDRIETKGRYTKLEIQGKVLAVHNSRALAPEIRHRVISTWNGRPIAAVRKLANYDQADGVALLTSY